MEEKKIEDFALMPEENKDSDTHLQ